MRTASPVLASVIVIRSPILTVLILRSVRGGASEPSRPVALVPTALSAGLGATPWLTLLPIQWAAAMFPRCGLPAARGRTRPHCADAPYPARSRFRLRRRRRSPPPCCCQGVGSVVLVVRLVNVQSRDLGPRSPARGSGVPPATRGHDTRPLDSDLALSLSMSRQAPPRNAPSRSRRRCRPLGPLRTGSATRSGRAPRCGAQTSHRGHPTLLPAGSVPARPTAPRQPFRDPECEIDLF